MKVKNKKVITVCIVIVCAVLAFCIFSFYNFRKNMKTDIKSVIYDVTLFKDGSAQIDEEWNVLYKSGTHTKFSHNIDIGAAYDYLEYDDDFLIKNSKIVWDDGEKNDDGTYSYRTSYIISDAVFESVGGVVFDYSFVGTDDVVDSVFINVTSPGAISLYDGSVDVTDIGDDAISFYKSSVSGMLNVKCITEKDGFGELFLYDETKSVFDDIDVWACLVFALVVAAIICVLCGIIYMCGVRAIRKNELRVAYYKNMEYFTDLAQRSATCDVGLIGAYNVTKKYSFSFKALLFLMLYKKMVQIKCGKIVIDKERIGELSDMQWNVLDGVLASLNLGGDEYEIDMDELSFAFGGDLMEEKIKERAYKDFERAVCLEDEFLVLNWGYQYGPFKRYKNVSSFDIFKDFLFDKAINYDSICANICRRKTKVKKIKDAEFSNLCYVMDIIPTIREKDCMCSIFEFRRHKKEDIEDKDCFKN